MAQSENQMAGNPPVVHEGQWVQENGSWFFAHPCADVVALEVERQNMAGKCCTAYPASCARPQPHAMMTSGPMGRPSATLHALRRENAAGGYVGGVGFT